jgi:hypothetical protein
MGMGQLIPAMACTSRLASTENEFALWFAVNGPKGRVQSQRKALKKGGAEENKACWQSSAKCPLGGTLTSLAGTLYPGLTYHLARGRHQWRFV